MIMHEAQLDRKKKNVRREKTGEKKKHGALFYIIRLQLVYEYIIHI
jgi:hypothetical protein